MERKPNMFLCALIPYVAMGVGLFLLHNAWLTILFYYSVILLFVFVAGNTSLFSEIFHGWSWFVLAFSIGLGAALYYLIVQALPIVVKEGVELGGLLEAQGLSGRGMLLFAIVSVIINPVMEELLWRGMLDSKPTRPCWIDVAFGGYHVPVLALAVGWPFVAVGFVGLCGFSWAMRFVKHTYGGLLMPCIAHLVGDLAIVLAIASVM